MLLYAKWAPRWHGLPRLECTNLPSLHRALTSSLMNFPHRINEGRSYLTLTLVGWTGTLIAQQTVSPLLPTLSPSSSPWRRPGWGPRWGKQLLLILFVLECMERMCFPDPNRNKNPMAEVLHKLFTIVLSSFAAGLASQSTSRWTVWAFWTVSPWEWIINYFAIGIMISVLKNAGTSAWLRY